MHFPRPTAPARWLVLVAAASWMAWSPPALGHPLAPALLELRELGGGQVEVTWKTSRLRAPGVELMPVLPADCRAASTPNTTLAGDSVTLTWRLDCQSASLVGAEVGVDGLAAARIDALVRVSLADGRVIRAVVRAATPRTTIPARQRSIDVLRAYALLGARHVLTGLDHLLFLAGLVLLARGGRRLVATVAAFALGHSLTLTLAAFDLIRLPTRPIELLVALSVFVLAVELAREQPVDVTRRAPPLHQRPWILAFGFGLLHGLGFANALADAGLPAGDLPLALFAFNLGIEAGVLALVAALLVARRLVRPLTAALPRWAPQIPLYVMGSLAAFWCFERAANLVR